MERKALQKIHREAVVCGNSQYADDQCTQCAQLKHQIMLNALICKRQQNQNQRGRIYDAENGGGERDDLIKAHIGNEGARYL